MTHTPTEIAAMIEQLEAWADIAKSGCVFPITGPRMLKAAAMLRDVAAERDALKAEVVRQMAYRNEAQIASFENAEAERDRLAAMVEKMKDYVEHKAWCGVDMGLAECDCGLSDVLKESENG